MTTGTDGVPGQPAPGYTGYRYFRSWSGDDGRWELFSYGVRPKWNSYTALKSRLISTDGSVVYHCPYGHTESFAATFGFVNNPDGGTSTCRSISSNDRLGVLNKLIAKVKGHSFNAGVNIAQAHQVANTVVSTLGSLGRAFMALRKGDVATAARQFDVTPNARVLRTKSVTGRWLELQYGWLPTISDAYEACKAFEAISSGPKSAKFSASKRYAGFQSIVGDRKSVV